MAETKRRARGEDLISYDRSRDRRAVEQCLKDWHQPRHQEAPRRYWPPRSYVRTHCSA